MPYDVSNEARFTINGTPSEDANGNHWYTASYSETLTVTLETNPSPVLSVTYEVYSGSDDGSPLASKNAPVLTWNETGEYNATLTAVNDSVTIDLPSSGIVTYTIRATVGLAFGGQEVYERMVAIPATTTPPVRKTVPAETSEWEQRGFSDTLNDMVDALMSGGYGGGTLDNAYDYGGSGLGREITVDSGSVTFTVPLTETEVALTLSNLEATNTSECLGIYNNATASTGYAIYIQGDQGDVDGVSPEIAWGHRIWTPGTITVGREQATRTRSFFTAKRYVTNPESYKSQAIIRSEVTSDTDNFGEISASSWYAGGSYYSEARVRSSGSIHLFSGGNLYMADQYRVGSTWSLIPGIQLSSSSDEWDAIEVLIGSEGSLFAAILAASASGNSLDGAYDFGGAGAGKSVTVDAGAVSFAVPLTGSTAALALTNLEPTNTSEVLNIYNEATSAGHKSIYLYGDAGDGDLATGHLIWSDGAISVGTNRTIDSDAVINYLTHTYDYTNEATVIETRSILGVDIADGTVEAYFRASGYIDTVGANNSAIATMYSTGQITIQSGVDVILLDAYTTATLMSRTSAVKLDSWTSEIRFDDGNRSGWTQAYLTISDSSTGWTDYKTAFGEVGLMEAVVAASASGGAVEPAGQIVYGTGTGVDSEANLHWDATNDELTITNSVNGTNWYDADAATIRLGGTATQGQIIISDQNFTVGTRTNEESADVELNILALASGVTSESTINVISEAIDGDTCYLNVKAISGADYGLIEFSSVDDYLSSVGISARGDAGTAEIKVRANPSGGPPYTDITLTAELIDFDDSYITNIAGYDFGAEFVNTVTSNTFTFNPDNGGIQRATISADSTWTLAAPTGVTRTMLTVLNSDSSAHTLTLTGTPTVSWAGDADGFTVPANGVMYLTTVYRGATPGWVIAVFPEL